MSYKPFLSGNRIYLREVRISDINERYYYWINDPEINQYLESRYFPMSVDYLVDYVAKHDGKVEEPFFAICLNCNEEHIGNIKLGPVNWIHRRADLGYFIGEKKMWGKGYASEAIALVLKFAFLTLNLNKISAGCMEENLGSRKVLEKNGFRQEGFLTGYVLQNGLEKNGILYGLRASEYLKG